MSGCGLQLKPWFGVMLMTASLLAAACGDDSPPSGEEDPTAVETFVEEQETADAPPLPLEIPESPPDPQEVPPATELELQAMRELLQTSVSILDEYWAEQFADQYQSVRSADGSYSPPNAVYMSLEGLICGERPLAPLNAYFCGSGPNAPYVAWDEEFLHSQAKQANSGAAVWVLAAHEYGHHVQWLLDAQYPDNDDDAFELGADCLAGAVSGQIARQGYYTPDNIRGSLEALNNIADQYELSGTHGTSDERRESFETGFTSGPTGCLNSNS